jgi:tRNA pseudouridine38-40 synthase
MRLAAGVHYVGTRFAGWQRQPHALAIQSLVEEALTKIADHPVEVVCAGRTDAGVHSTAQVIHFDTEAQRADRGWLLGANAELPSDVALAWISPVSPAFHARFSALARSYRYLILNRPLRAPLWFGRACLWRQPLDANVMHDALQCLVGTHDFSSFRAAECQSPTATRRIERISVERHGDFVVLEVTANAFLHHMVRNIAGSALRVGEGAREAPWIAEVLASRDRRLAGLTAPAGGLYFVDVRYPADLGLPVKVLAPLSAIIGPSDLPMGSE